VLVMLLWVARQTLSAPITWLTAYDGGNADEAAVQGLMRSRSLPQLRTMTSTIHVRGQSRQTAEDHSGHQEGNADESTAQVLTRSRSLTPELRMSTSIIHVRRQRRMSTEVYSTDFVYVKPMPGRVGHANNGDGAGQDNELDNDDINIGLLDAYIELVRASFNSSGDESDGMYPV
jgi:hypothetical protein